MEDYHRTLLAAQGYCELKMFDDALAELRTLSPEARNEPDAVEVRICILTQAHRWEPALEASRLLCRLQPEAPSGYIHAAYCLHELKRTAEAKQLLLKGPAALRDEATFHYNLACYECALGDLVSARSYLKQSFQMDKKFREFAKKDPDLEPLRREGGA